MAVWVNLFAALACGGVGSLPIELRRDSAVGHRIGGTKTMDTGSAWLQLAPEDF